MQTSKGKGALPKFSIGRFLQPQNVSSTSSIYTTLDVGRREIRVASILPGRWSENVSCKLTVLSLDDNPMYEALSYTWGDPLDKTPIFMESVTFLITKNLHWALRRLRHTDKTRHIWVDALCINQSNSKQTLRPRLISCILIHVQRSDNSVHP
jgi:hypothetical protein